MIIEISEKLLMERIIDSDDCIRCICEKLYKWCCED